ncbi:DUF559 domain-containing protein [soil metagenome]
MDYAELTGPFLRTKGLGNGIPQHILDGPAFAAPFRGVRVSAAQPVSVHTRAAAALLLTESGVVSHHTAAELWGAVVPRHSDTHVTVHKPIHRPRRPGLSAHVFRQPRDTTWLRGLPITTPAQTFCDLAAALDVVDLVVAGDSLVHAGLVSPGQLVSAVNMYAARPKLRAKQAAELVRLGVESPMETRSRLLIVLAGLPEPQINSEVTLDDRTYRLDMSYPHYRLAFEYDGRQHATSSHQWQRDITRREDLDRWAWRLMILRSEDIFKRPLQALERIVDAMRAAGMPIDSLEQEALTRVDRHFPGTGRRL